MATTFKSINTGSIADGSYAEIEWTPDKDITITKMMLVERSDISLSGAQVYISIADVPYTRDFVPGSVIGSDPEYCWKPNLKVPKGAKIYSKITNNTGNTINVDVVFEYE
jgi:hypothetical protein